jgi:transcriptional regulator with XRE-family HTH domain
MEFKEFGEELLKIRKYKKITQEQLATDLNMSRATISNFETGKAVNIGFNKVIEIMDYVGFELTLKEKSAFPTFEELRDGR